MNKVSDTISAKLKKEMLIDDLGVLKINYAMAVLRNEGIKLLILLLFYSYLGQVSMYLFCVAVLIPVRIFSGGLHMKTSFTCFCFSFVFFFLAIILLPKIQISVVGSLILLALSVVVIWIFSPISTLKKPIVTKEKYRRCKNMSIISSSVWAGFLLLQIENTSYFQCGVWVFTLQACQLMAAHIKQKNKGRLSI